MKIVFVHKFGFKIIFLPLCLVIFFFPLIVFSPTIYGENQEPMVKKAHPSQRPEIKYTATNFRDPFIPQFRIPEEKEPEVSQKIETIKPKVSALLSIQGIIWNPDNPMVIINNQLLRKGESIATKEGMNVAEEIRIMKIDKDGVTVFYSGKAEKLPAPASLELKKYKEERNE